MSLRTRFAPSPTGLLHLGHAYSALLASDMARAQGGSFVLRIEDLDRGRCRAHFEKSIFEDLHWLGIGWEVPVMRQSQRDQAYDQALQKLIGAGLCYPCQCSRRDIRDVLSAPQEGARAARTPPYPGTCRARAMSQRGQNDTIRLDMARALATLGDPKGFSETGERHRGAHALDARQMIQHIGDVVLARRGVSGFAYHLVVVVDDGAQQVNTILRGEDLFDATFVHVLLQRLLGLATPQYHHHRLIRDAAGKRLAKRDDARAIAMLRSAGQSPADIRRAVALAPAG